MSRESTWKELETYNEHEQFYLTLHLARQDPVFFQTVSGRPGQRTAVSQKTDRP